MKTGTLIDKKTNRKKLSESDIIKRIRTAVNIATGDDGHQAERVLDIFVMLCKMSEKEYKKEVKFYG
tara:strand:+ start:53 stop:253 length:201 start_codon:yes stop_codon:yes gene_type:complete